jgi:hypothetical protein
MKVNEIIKKNQSFKVINTQKDMVIPTIVVDDKLTTYGQNKNSNYTPPKKKRK